MNRYAESRSFQRDNPFETRAHASPDDAQLQGVRFAAELVWRRIQTLLDLRAGRADDLRPPRDLALDVAAELLGGRDFGLRAVARETIAEFRRLDDFRD